MGDHWQPRITSTFLAIGLVVYLALLTGAETLVRRHGDANPFFRIWSLDTPGTGWLILGASHAMPLDFADTRQRIEDAHGTTIVNLAATGAGPYVLRLIGGRFFQDHHAANVLIVVDGFGYADRRWNEDRIGDPDMLARIPYDRRTMAVLTDALPRLPFKTWLDYGTGFSKLNNPDRLSPDIWTAEARFDESRRRPSAAAEAERIDYLYPQGGVPEQRYLDDLAALVAMCQQAKARVVIVRPPLPSGFREKLPMEAEFARRIDQIATRQGVQLFDFSNLLPEPSYYFDTDHLNRSGVQAWLNGGLSAILSGNGP